MADANQLTMRLGTIQRAIISYLFSLPTGKGCSIAKYCEDRDLENDPSVRSRYYKAALLLRRRGLLVTSTKGRKAILTLSGKGSAAAYAIAEEEGQTVISVVKSLPRTPVVNIPSKRRAKQARIQFRAKRAAARTGSA